MKFACPVEASPFVADPHILIIFFLFCFFFLPAASRGTEKILEGGVQARHLPNKYRVVQAHGQEAVQLQPYDSITIDDWTTIYRHYEYPAYQVTHLIFFF